MNPPLAHVRPMAPADLASVAELHRRCFPTYQSTKLGTAYCRRMLRAYDQRPETWISVATDDSDRTLGYLVAAPPATQKDIQRVLLPWAALASLRQPRAAAAAVVPAVRRVRGRLTRSDETPASATAAPPSEETTPDATIRVVLIGVAPDARGQGVADLLLGSFADTARARGHRTADLSVAPDNRAAQAAYARNGWISEGADASHFRLNLDGPTTSSN